MDSGVNPGGAAARRDFASLLKSSEKTVLALLASASQAILCVDKRGRIILANARTEEIFGYSSEELLGATVETLLPESAAKAHIQHRADFFANPRIRPMGIGMELAGRHKSGQEFPVEVSLSYVTTGDGTFAIAFVTDISQRKQLEERLLHSQKMEAVGRLAGGVAHDFNNMLTIIAGYNRMMLDRVSPLDPLRGYCEEVLKAADRAAALTHQLLAFSRRQVLQPRVVSVNTLITSTEKMLRRLIGEDIDLKLRLAPETANIRADPGQIEQVIFNLAVNARDAMPTGGSLVIETSDIYLDSGYVTTHLGVQPGNFVMMAVSDTGHGMDAATKSRIFEPFFTTKPNGQGTGLGLATVYGIVKQSGGDIWVYSEPDRGTTFKVYFPAYDEPNPEEAEEPPVAARRGTETILVVEDEPGVRILVTEMLKQQGYRVLPASGPMEALQIAGQHNQPIHMLLTDVVMPQMSGKQLADALVADRPHIRVLFLSGYTENTVVHHGVLEPGFHFLGKPFSQEALARKVREVLDSKA